MIDCSRQHLELELHRSAVPSLSCRVDDVASKDQRPLALRSRQSTLTWYEARSSSLQVPAATRTTSAINVMSIHWHGIRPLNTTHMDAVNGVTQCPLAPGSSMSSSCPTTATPSSPSTRTPRTPWLAHRHISGGLALQDHGRRRGPGAGLSGAVARCSGCGMGVTSGGGIVSELVGPSLIERSPRREAG